MTIERFINNWQPQMNGYAKFNFNLDLKELKQQIRAEAIDEFVELYEKFCNSDIVCGSEDCIGKFCPRCFRDNFMEQVKEQNGK